MLIIFDLFNPTSHLSSLYQQAHTLPMPVAAALSDAQLLHTSCDRSWSVHLLHAVASEANWKGGGARLIKKSWQSNLKNKKQKRKASPFRRLCKNAQKYAKRWKANSAESFILKSATTHTQLHNKNFKQKLGRLFASFGDMVLIGWTNSFIEFPTSHQDYIKTYQSARVTFEFCII